MKTIHTFKALAATLISTALLSSQASAMTGLEIMTLRDNQPTPESTHAAVKLEIIDKNGDVKERLIENWSDDNGGLNRSVMVFRSPASVKNTRFLTLENDGKDDDQWIFLPALNKIRRIASGDADGSFMGTEFTYDDLSSRDLDESTYELLGDETCGSYTCWVIEAIPKDLSDSAYSKSIAWIVQDDDMYSLVKTELYDKKGELLKVLTVEELNNIDGFWVPNKTIMTNVQTKRSSVLTNMQIELNKANSNNLYSKRFLQTGRTN